MKAVKLGAMLAGKGSKKGGQSGGATSGGGGGPAGGRASPSGSSTSSFVAGYDAAAAANRPGAPLRAPPLDGIADNEEDGYGGDDRYLGTRHNGPISQYLGDGADDPRGRPNSNGRGAGGVPAHSGRRGGGFGGAGRMGDGGDEDVDVRGGGYYDPNEIGGKQRGGFSMGQRVAWKPAGSPGGDPTLGQYIPGHSPAQRVALAPHTGGGAAFSQQGRFGVNDSSGYGQSSPGWERSHAPPGTYHAVQG